jgi:membrane protein
MTLVDRLAQYASSATGAAQFLRSLGETGPRLGLASLLASVITASTYGEGLLRAVDTLEDEQRPTRTVLGRLRVLPYLGVFPLVTLLGLLAVMVLPERLGDGVTGQALGIYLTFWVGWALATALLVVLYRLFAARTLRWAAIVWASLAAGSFLTGMSLGWVLVLRFGLTVGRAFGGSELVGHIVLLTIYLLFVQVTILMGYLLARSIDHLLSAQVARSPESVGSGVRAAG